MARSFLAHNPDCDVIILAPDLSCEQIKPVPWPIPTQVQILGLDDIDDPVLGKLHQYLDGFELCCAAKSFLLQQALFKYGYKKALVLDPDIASYASFDPVWMALERVDMAVTPHTNAPFPVDGINPDDWELTYSGFINGGFWSAASTPAINHSLDWMKDKVTRFGFFIPRIALYADQTWMSCLPWFFPDHTAILRNPGLNVAYWNLHERALSHKEGAWLCNGQDLICFHFSGYSDRNPDRLTIQSNRSFDGDTGNLLRRLVEEYGTALAEMSSALPALNPDLPCSTLALGERLQIYETVHGKKPEFANRLADMGPGNAPPSLLQWLKSYAGGMRRLTAGWRRDLT